MFDFQFPVQIKKDLQNISIKTLIIEFLESDIVKKLENFNIQLSNSLLQKIQNRSEKDKKFIIYPENENISQVILFFPNPKTLSDDRADIVREYKNDIAFMGDDFISDAFENFCLASYEFNQYKTKKEKIAKIFLVENEKQEEEIFQKIPLIKAIMIARNLVNMPPQDLNPETFSRAIFEKKWNHFHVDVLGNNELRELGCDLIRAV